MILQILFDHSFNGIQKVMLLIGFVLSAVIAISCHEYAHGFAAYKLGDPTAKVQGRLTLNPVAHFEPIGLVMFVLVGFGFARPVPINPYNFKDYKKGMLITSFAGVIANLILAVIGFGLMIGAGYFYMSTISANNGWTYFHFFFFKFATYLTLLNAVLIAFNLLPIYPLDGFRVVETLTPPNNRFVEFMRRYGAYILIGIVVIGFIFERAGLPQGDLFGMYLSGVQKGILNLWYKIMGKVMS